MVADVFQVVAPVVTIAMIGFAYAWRRPVDMTVTNRITTDCLLPILIFSSLSGLAPDWGEIALLSAYALAVVVGSGILAWPVLRLVGAPLRAIVPAMMFKNYGNLGLPLALFAFGEEGLRIMLIMCVAGNVLHFSLGFWILRGACDPQEILRNPIVLSAIAGLAFSAAGITLPQFVDASLDLLGTASIPLMLFALGVRLTRINIGDTRTALVGAAACPACGLLSFLILVALVPGIDGLERDVLLVFSVLPPAILNYMFAERFGVHPDAVAATVLAGTLVALGSIPLALAFVS